MTARVIGLLLLLWLCACDKVTVLRYQPSRAPIAGASLDHGTSTVSRPARGGTIATTLADGFPVWVVHHVDGTLTVVSGVAPTRPRTAGGYLPDNVGTQVGRSLVAWVPGVRRFLAGSVVFDEHGKALGYAGYDLCLDRCPELASMPPALHSLDVFTVTTRADDTLEVGPLVEGAWVPRASTWIRWWREHARDQDFEAAHHPASPRRTFAEALALRDGQYAVVEGNTSRSTHHEPAICEPGSSCKACGATHLPLAGIRGSDAAHIQRDGWWRDPKDYRRSLRQTYVEGEPGTFLVRKQGETFELVAGMFRGICSGSW